MNPLIKIVTAICLFVCFAAQVIHLKPEFERARLKAMNEISPDAFDEIVSLSLGKSSLNRERLDAYLRYAQQLTQMDPKRADAWGLSGFCLFHQGEKEKSLQAYQKASELMPAFYGFHYNLAFINFKMQNYQQAAEEIQKTLLCDPRDSMLYILSASKIYALMLVAKMNHGIPAEDQLKNGYQKSYQLLAAVQYRIKMGAAFPGEDQFTLEGF